MFNTLHDKLLRLAKTKKALNIFFLITFLESFIFPIPPDVMMLPIIAANRHLLWNLGWMAAIVSIFGGVVGYCIGFYLFHWCGEAILNFYHLENSFCAFSETFNRYGFWIISLKGLTPIPFKLIAITAGITKFDMRLFFISSCIARFSRFYIITIILWLTGDRFQYYLKKYFPLYLLGIIISILAGFGLFKFIKI